MGSEAKGKHHIGGKDMNTTVETVEYKGRDLVVRGGAWLDDMNSCFYTVIDEVKGFDICKENGNDKIFALPNPYNGK